MQVENPLSQGFCIIWQEQATDIYFTTDWLLSIYIITTYKLDLIEFIEPLLNNGRIHVFFQVGLKHALRQIIWRDTRNFNNFERLKIMQSMFSDKNGVKLKINNKEILGKS